MGPNNGVDNARSSTDCTGTPLGTASSARRPERGVSFFGRGNITSTRWQARRLGQVEDPGCPAEDGADAFATDQGAASGPVAAGTGNGRAFDDGVPPAVGPCSHTAFVRRDEGRRRRTRSYRRWRDQRISATTGVPLGLLAQCWRPAAILVSMATDDRYYLRAFDPTTGELLAAAHQLRHQPGVTSAYSRSRGGTSARSWWRLRTCHCTPNHTTNQRVMLLVRQQTCPGGRLLLAVDIATGGTHTTLDQYPSARHPIGKQRRPRMRTPGTLRRP